MVPKATTTSDLKLRLKEIGMSQSGDKGTLEYRLARGNESINLNLRTPEDEPVHIQKLSKLKRFAARAGVSPIGSLDEVLFAYIAFLKNNSGTNTVNSDSAAAGAGSGSSGNDTIVGNSATTTDNTARLSKKVLELSEGDDFVGILRLGATPLAAADLTESSSVAVLRKSYLKLSLKLHPDKNRKNSDATKVFQAVVNAFERLSQPELFQEDTQSKNHKALSRSNDGCKRTRVCCPRCANPWSESSVEGNPDYFYNFMMTGLKSFNCATCLLEFGCMTAIHRCPYCKHNFEYHPNDYHRKITCGSKRCTKPFGFYMFHCSDRTIKNLKVEVKELRERKAKQTEQKRRRAESAKRRKGSSNNDNNDAAVAFLLGLANECPRCGMSLADLSEQDELYHLQNCNDDEGKISANTRKKEAREEAKVQEEKQQELQDDVAAKAAWELLGRDNEDMWLLTDGALEKECTEQGVAVAKGKKASSHEMIASLVEKSKSRALTKFDKSSKKTTDSLPSNLHSMTVSQLRAVAASRGIVIDTKLRKVDIIELIESKVEAESSKGDNDLLMLTNDGNSQPDKKRKAFMAMDPSDSDDSDSDSDYNE